MAKRKRQRRRKNPVDISRYGDLFYDMAAEFNELVLITIAEIYEHDPSITDSEMVPIEKMAKIKKSVGAHIFKAWVQMQKGR